MNRPVETKQNKLLTGCVTVSFALHVVFITLIQSHSLWFYSAPTPSLSTAPWAQLVDKTPRNQILEESFTQPFEPVAEQIGARRPQRENERLDPHPTRIASSEPELMAHTLPPFPIENLLASNDDLFQVLSFPLPAVEPLDLFADLPKDLIIPKAEIKPEQRPLYPYPEMIGESQLKHTEAPLPVSILQTVSYMQPLTTPTPLTLEKELAKALPAIPIPNLPRLPTLEELGTANLSDCFESELVFLPREDGPGYIFALTLIPRGDLNLPKLRQHITFLIDRSNSIQRDRLQATKQAVQKALEDLYTDDTFNIIVFDSKVDKLFSNLTPVSGQALAQADQFLSTIQLGSFFSLSDPFRPLLQTIPGTVRNDELYTAVLFTDGESLAKKNVQRSLLHHWTEQNNGRVALYTMGMDSDRNLPSLDATSIFNKGKLVTASTNRGLRRKLLKLMKTIRSPVAKNITATSISSAPNKQIELYPKSTVSPYLYLDHPYVIFGVTDTLDDFILFVQGRMKNQWLNLKKRVSFVNGKRGGHTLKAEWALQRAYQKYEQYAIDENPQHLAEAQALLEPYDLQTAFQ